MGEEEEGGSGCLVGRHGCVTSGVGSVRDGRVQAVSAGGGEGGGEKVAGSKGRDWVLWGTRWTLGPQVGRGCHAGHSWERGPQKGQGQEASL